MRTIANFLIPLGLTTKLLASPHKLWKIVHMSSLAYDTLKSGRMSINALSRATKLDRATVRKYLEDQELESETIGSSKTYDFLSAIRALIHCSKGQNTADRRNDAQAHKAEVETQILLKKYIPIEEAAQVHRELLGALNRQIQEAQIPDDVKEKMVDLIQSTSNPTEHGDS